MEIKTRGQMWGLAIAALTAVAVSFLAQDAGWSWSLDFGFIGSNWSGWPILSASVLIAAWVNVFAWAQRLWLVAIICGLMVLFVPWGFLYPGILAGPMLAMAAGLAWARSKNASRFRKDPSGTPALS